MNYGTNVVDPPRSSRGMDFKHLVSRAPVWLAILADRQDRVGILVLEGSRKPRLGRSFGGCCSPKHRRLHTCKRFICPTCRSTLTTVQVVSRPKQGWRYRVLEHGPHQDVSRQDVGVATVVVGNVQSEGLYLVHVQWTVPVALHRLHV